MDTRQVVDASIREARQVNERWIAWFVTVVASVVAVFEGARLLRSGGMGSWVEGAGGSSLVLLIAVTYAVVYGVALWRREAASEGPFVGVKVVLEVSVGSLPVFAAGLVDPEQALLDAPVVLYALAIFVSVLRLRPGVALAAGGLAAGQWIALYYGFTAGLDVQTTSLAAGEAWTRVILLGATGVLAWHISRSYLGLVGTAASASVERERVRRAFGSYVAEPVVEQVLRGDLSVAPERRVITVLFVDIRSFTRFSEAHPPDEVLGRLNRALHAFAGEVVQRGGIVNKFLGDGLMALFGAPIEQVDHARNAGEAAQAIRERARAFAASGEWPGLRIGVGVHCGEVVVGDVGGDHHREYTAIGDVVNVAARVEALTKELGVEVLVTEAVVDAVGPGFAFGESVDAALRGRTEPVRVRAMLVS